MSDLNAVDFALATLSLAAGILLLATRTPPANRPINPKTINKIRIAVEKQEGER